MTDLLMRIRPTVALRSFIHPERSNFSNGIPSALLFPFDQAIQTAMTDVQVEEIKRHFGVAAETLRSDIRQIAEGHSRIGHELHEMRNEVREEFKEMRALMPPSFSQLDQRIRTLETDISILKTRMDHLETHRA